MFSKKPFPAAVGIYRFLFLYFEPLSVFTVLFSIFARGRQGAISFYNDLAPIQGSDIPAMDPRIFMLVWHLSNLYIMVGCLMVLVLHMLREYITDYDVQERLFAYLVAMMSVGDLVHAGSAWFALPETVRSNPGSWSFLLHGNLTIPIVMMVFRFAWFAGFGRGERPTQKNGTSFQKA
ncbi:hypothetical protein AX16_000547 [Volvariella volvacea WC 439]|nr:hypothetical protein AX16_000547 [Volvariella volvacea WC 439]